MQWQQINCALFDMDGTLLDLHFDNHFWLEHLPLRYGEKNGLSTAQAKEHLYPLFQAKRGQLDWYCVDYWSDALQIDIEALKKEVAQHIAMRPYAEDFLIWLKARGIRCLLITNAHRKSLELKLAHARLQPYFEQLISSHDFGFAKEHDPFWLRLSQDYQVDLARAVFFDDSLDVLRSARRNGVAHLYGIAQPDLSKPDKSMEEFIAVHDFRHLMHDETVSSIF